MPSPSEPPSAPSPALPGEWIWVETLREREGVLVARARRGEEEAVLRVESSEAAQEALSELAALSACCHRGLARLLDFGACGEGFYVARQWVDGDPLEEWASAREPAEVGRVVAQLALALDHLHTQGFVHGDLKPENVLVDREGEPVLCDFGLARSTFDHAPAGGGTLYSIAPERLAGLPPDPRSDLFSLGVLLHQLCVGSRPPAREFYGRFPRVPFLEAVGGDASDLPPFARDLVERTTERDPAARPSDALEVARSLALRLSLALEIDQRLSAPQLDPDLGREAWAERVLESLGHGASSRV